MGLPGLRLTDLLGSVGLFAGQVPAAPPVGTFRRPSLPSDAVPGAGDEQSLGWVRDPLGRDDPPPLWAPRRLLLPGGAPARQVSPTTCGAAVLAMLRYAGDPVAALAVAGGDGRDGGDGAGQGDPAGRFAADQQRVHRACTRGPLGLPSWPPSLGTPPWAAAAHARYGPVRYTHRVVGAPGSAAARRVLDAALDAARAGVPVPLYSGGDLARGPATAVPRHVVLLTTVTGAAPDATATLYEPSSGTLHSLPAAVLRAGTRARTRPDRRGEAARTRALGGWPHVVWAILPRGSSDEAPPWRA
ncbi:hypothetical protein GCM10023216_02320 [Isoptericola chiayiensis]|uniref:Peptidase C39-like domain-containing protein n=1 Tax=Isoptericola chiayiensis TaxID=579446 RepID=A0ABP8XZ72_9MICO|nr:hypothetical protein [Isoptericola chiayiensis]NOW01051.1 hypothetical protein [Isoptericola chiayiensis]